MNCWASEYYDEPSSSNKWWAISWPAEKLLTAQELLSMELVSDRNLATAILWFSTFVVPYALPLKSIMRERQFTAGVASDTTFGRRNLSATTASAMH